MEKLLTADEVRERCGLRNVTTIYRWAKEGVLPSVVLSARAVRFRPADVDEFIEAHMREAVNA